MSRIPCNFLTTVKMDKPIHPSQMKKYTLPTEYWNIFILPFMIKLLQKYHFILALYWNIL